MVNSTPDQNLEDMARTIAQLRNLGATIVGLAALDETTSFEGQRDTILKLKELMDIHAANMGMSIDWSGYYMSQEIPSHFSRKAREFLESNNEAFNIICAAAKASV